jgi:hypothetical protein
VAPARFLTGIGVRESQEAEGLGKEAHQASPAPVPPVAAPCLASPRTRAKYTSFFIFFKERGGSADTISGVLMLPPSSPCRSKQEVQ